MLIASQRRLRPQLSRCTLYEMEDVVRSVDDADLLQLSSRPGWTPPLWERATDSLERHAGIRIEVLPRLVPVEVERDYDLFYFHAENVHDLTALRGARGWRERSRIAVCRIEEMWLQALELRKALRPLRDFDHVFLGCAQTAPALEATIGVPVHYLAPATDSLRFCPYPDPPARSIDCLYIGRRDAQLHEALRRHAETAHPRFRYVYDTREGNSAVSHAQEHRTLLAQQIQRAKFFAVTVAKSDSPHTTRGQEEVGYRFFEGAAAGAVLVGRAPACDSFRACFDWSNAVVDLPPNAAGVARRFAELEGNAPALQALSRTNVVESLRRHDYAHRWAAILEHAGLAARPALRARLDHLAALASHIAQPNAASSLEHVQRPR